MTEPPTVVVVTPSNTEPSPGETAPSAASEPMLHTAAVEAVELGQRLGAIEAKQDQLLAMLPALQSRLEAMETTQARLMAELDQTLAAVGEALAEVTDEVTEETEEETKGAPVEVIPPPAPVTPPEPQRPKGLLRRLLVG